ncbi:MAG: hypothetical protein AAF605_04370 [Myxococcota bacterium]
MEYLVERLSIFLPYNDALGKPSIRVSRSMPPIQLSYTARVGYGAQTMPSLTDTRLSEEVFLALPESSTPMELLDGELARGASKGSFGITASRGVCP